MTPEILFQLLNATGNVAMIAVAVGFWKLDRRLYRVELHLWKGKKQ